jgi:hypothetical protein
MQSTITRAAIVATAALLALPGIAAARHGQDNQPSIAGQARGTDDNSRSTTAEPGVETNDARQGDGRSGDDSAAAGTTGADHRGDAKTGDRVAKATETFTLRGVVSAVDTTANTVTMTIVKASHGGRAGRRLAGRSLTVDLTNARLGVSDVNGDGVADAADIAEGDRVEVRLQLPRPVAALPTAPIPAQRFRDDDAR